MNRYQQELEKRKEDHLLRSLPTESNLIDFYSNDYLGFARSSQLQEEIQKEYASIEPKQTGATGSRLLSGNTDYAETLEREIADYHQANSALLFSSGYSANVGLLSALGKRGVTFICDELIHASMIDGVRLSYADRIKFKHNNIEDLEKQLIKPSGDKIVLIESIYSMDGDIAPLQDIVDLCKKHQAELIVDEAHAIGIIGEKGDGLCASLGIQKDVLATVVTFGKAMGTHGATVLGEEWLKSYLINFSRSFVYSTAPSYHQLASIRCSYQLNAKANEERRSLKKNIEYFISKRDKTNALNWIDSSTSIQSLIIEGNEVVIEKAEELRTAGFNVLPIRSPTVPVGTERLRISVHAHNTKDEIDVLFKTIEKWHLKN